MPGFTFVAKEATLSLGVGEFESKFPRLTYVIELGFGESVNLSSGENFSELAGRLTIRNKESGRAPIQGDAIGLMSYFSGKDTDIDYQPASCLIEVEMNELLFDELISAAKSGLMPSEIFIEVEDSEHIQYDWQPDGSGKKWDNKNSRHLKVESARFIVPLAGGELGRISQRTINAGIEKITFALNNKSLAEYIDSVKNDFLFILKWIFFALLGIGVLIIYNG